MSLRRNIAQAFAAGHPSDVASLLESGSAADAAWLLRSLTASAAAGVLRQMVPSYSRRVLIELTPEESSALLSELSLDVITALLRRVPEDRRVAIIEALPEDLAPRVSASIAYPVRTAGALMDPLVLAVPDDLSVREARAVVDRESEHVTYNLYVVDRGGVLLGVLNLQELLSADEHERLPAVMSSAHHRILVTDDHRSILEHVGWREVYSLPVVGDNGRFLGAIRYGMLRRLERELEDVGGPPSAVTTNALGDLFRTGIVGVIDALARSITPDRPAAQADGAKGGRES